ncbi:nucleotidyl transferase AbiEii/AbiGii toxin family protein [bacterium]|nr:nucleotidyl transferase AbiEii/AbiGii toxin family protein [bacterium]
MKKNISLHYHLLDKDRKKVFLGLKFFGKEANLAGGTALCLQIGHRLSFDFDVFFQRELGRKDLRKLRRRFNIKEVKCNTSEHIKVVTFENVTIDLVYYPYRPLFKKIPTISLPLFSIKDIALDKADTIGRRALWRDYVDLFFLLKKEYISLEQIIKLAEKKFGVEFNPRLFLQQLIYFRDVQISKISWVEEKYSPYQIQNFLKKQVKDFRKRNII